jgi:hypothetical protein
MLVHSAVCNLGPDHGVGHFRQFRITARFPKTLVTRALRSFSLMKQAIGVADAVIEAAIFILAQEDCDNDGFPLLLMQKAKCRRQNVSRR